MRRPASASFASAAGTTIATASTSGFASSLVRLSSVKAHAPCTAPSTTTCPRSRALTPLRASAATAKWNRVAPSARVRRAATAAARRMALRVTSLAFPTPTSRIRCGFPAGGYKRLVSSRLPVRSPVGSPGAGARPAALSRAAIDAGTSAPWARATARSGVSIWGRATVATALVIVLADMLDNALGERGGRDLDGAGQLAGEIVGHALGGDGPLDAANDGRGHVRPGKLFEHHRAREDEAAGVDLVLSRVLGCGAVRDLVPPLSEPALRELHDVALVHERHRRTPRLDRVLNRLRDQALGAEFRHRLDADRAAGPDLRSVALGEKLDDRVRRVASGLVLDARIDVFDVLTEDHDVELPGLLHGRRHAFEVAHGPDAGVEVEQLAQRDVERADPTADGRGERPLDRDPVCADRRQRGLGQPATRRVEGLLPRQHLQPLHPTAALRDLLDDRVEHAARGAPDVGAGAVALDGRDDRPVGHDPTFLLELDAVTHLSTLLRGPALVVGAVYTLRLRSRHRPCDSPRRGLHHPIPHVSESRKSRRCRYANRTQVGKPRTRLDGRGVRTLPGNDHGECAPSVDGHGDIDGGRDEPAGDDRNQRPAQGPGDRGAARPAEHAGHGDRPDPRAQRAADGRQGGESPLDSGTVVRGRGEPGRGAGRRAARRERGPLLHERTQYLGPGRGERDRLHV